MKRFEVEAKPCQSADAEGAGCNFVLQARMILQTGLGANDGAVSIDLRLQCLGTIERLASSHKELDPGSIFDLVLPVDRLPQSHAVRAERPGWGAGHGRVAGNELKVFCH
ncbi:hypothetical protein [Mesorhizobium sp.]|uniref:hypothetical protein n=1 Tax=Mesorhizobium sp. TaxID=1871066 RepID=UPI000FE5BA00|nr:hypothetical protein [Mesorhizobium sp.]RWH03732.1 MAG: hypothetical protein EOQ72_01615 [Mesorhizobium sp.]TIR93799.1 MAG: hypothetical protein E5X08_08370 [Mesorhizobium sp.]